MAVKAAPDFHHEDARAGCPSAVPAPRRPVAAGRRAISLKVILLSAVLAVAGIGGAHAAPEQCKKYGYEPTGDWTCTAAIPGYVPPTIIVQESVAASVHCIHSRPVQIWFKCCDRKFYSLPSMQHGKYKMEHVAYHVINIDLGLPGGVPAPVKQAAGILGVSISKAWFKKPEVVKADCERNAGRLSKGEKKIKPIDAPYLDCAPKKKRHLTKLVKKLWFGVWPYDGYEKLKPDDFTETEDDPAERDGFEKFKPKETTKDDPAKDKETTKDDPAKDR